jgi:light-regulated signal transduction histidine kinase (bacteriophytochrome)
MKHLAHDVEEEYAAALESHLAGASEAGLHHAYEFGRRALSDGLGVLDMTMLHHKALGVITASSPPSDERARLERAAEFLAEALSPFEMALRGYREANVRLAEMNRTLANANAATMSANRELEAFSYSVAHDLRAPLRSIDGFSKALAEDCADGLNADGKQHLRHISESVQHMALLIDGLLSLAQVTRSELRRERVDLTALAYDTARRLRESQPDRKAEFAISEGLIADGDVRLLSVVVENLLGNAWKFTRKSAVARIEFGARVENGKPVYHVRDNGAGFNMAYAAKLFGAFQRLHKASEFEGTGIGLATVERIIRRHGGRIWAEGAVDRGATFYFALDEGGG